MGRKVDEISEFSQGLSTGFEGDSDANTATVVVCTRGNLSLSLSLEEGDEKKSIRTSSICTT